MALVLGKKGGRKFTRLRTAPVSEINVTPLVDVMLVLLIVFMVTAPLLTVGVSVDLPKSKGQALSENKEPLTVTINSEGKLFLQNTEVKMENLIPQLKGIVDANPNARIYVRGDQALNYGKIVEVMGLISSSGFVKVALVADMPTHRKGLKSRG